MSFYTLYRDLIREGPGEATDVAWALAQAGTKKNAQICDVACGSGADIAALLAVYFSGVKKALQLWQLSLKQGGASDELQQVLDEAAYEIALWRGHQDDFGYLLSVAHPL